MKVRLVREIRKQVVILGPHKHRNAAFGLCKFAHQLTDSLQVDIFGNGAHKSFTLIPQRIRKRHDTFFGLVVDFGPRNGKTLSSRCFQIPSLGPEFLFSLVQLKVPCRDVLAVCISVIRIDNKRRQLEIFFQDFFNIVFFGIFENLRNRFELVFKFCKKEIDVRNDFILEFYIGRTERSRNQC